MSDRPHPLLKAERLAATPEFEFRHPLNPNSLIYLRSLAVPSGLTRTAVTMGRLPPGRESFVYHSHQFEEEWLYVLSGRGIAEIDDGEYEVGPGDFMGFAAPSVAHHMRNPFDDDLVYLMGGEKLRYDVGIFPRLGMRALRDGDDAYIIADSDLQPFRLRDPDEGPE